MTRASVLGGILTMLFVTCVHSQTPALSPEEQRQVDANMAAPKLDASITVSSLKLDSGPVKDALRSLSDVTGLTARSDQNVPELDKLCSVNFVSTSLEAALRTLLGANGIAFTVTGRKSVFLYSDTPANRQKFTESVQTFVVTKAEPGALLQMLMKQPFMQDGIRPTGVTGRPSRAIYVRATADKMAEIAKFIAANDK